MTSSQLLLIEELKKSVKLHIEEDPIKFDFHDETLEVQLPNIFVNQEWKGLTNEGQKLREEDEKLTALKSAGESLRKVPMDNKNTYYMLVKMLFPEFSGLPPLSILLIDTIFYNPDGSMTYVYTDSKRGLTRTKSKNYIQFFLKRKMEVDFDQELPFMGVERKFSERRQSRYSFMNNSATSSVSLSSLANNRKKQKFDLFQTLDYVALLRYKDESFIRLKQNQFKSLFIRPVQANQKYKITNNTHYLQMVPQMINYEEGTLFNVEFVLQKHENTQLFLTAIQKHEQQTSFNNIKASSAVKQKLKQTNISEYLLYLVFQIFAYVNIHYHKKIEVGVFQFMKIKNMYYLSNARKLVYQESQSIKNQYAKKQLFQEFVGIDPRFDLAHEKVCSGVVKAVQEIFDKENKRIYKNVSNFVNHKFQQIKNVPDVIESNNIFKSINEKYVKKNLHQLFENQEDYQKFLKKKQRQLDGMSALTSISNICRKKRKNLNKFEQIPIPEQKFYRSAKQNTFTQIFHKKMQSQSRIVTSNRPKTGIWTKNSLIGKKQPS